jgi:hypothetical protein
MLTEMLAADELYPNDLDRLRASGFLARQYFKFNRTSWLDETVEHTAKSMLGLTFNCAKCHDHKYDPFSQVEYYQMRAFFEPYQIRTDAVPGELDLEKDGIPRAYDCNLDAPTYLHRRGDDRNPDQSRILDPAVPAFLAFDQFAVVPVELPADASQPGLRPHVVENYRAAAAARIASARVAVDAAVARLRPLTTAAPDSPELRLAQLNLNVAEKSLVSAESEMDSIVRRATADAAHAVRPAPPELPMRIEDAARAERAAAVANGEEQVAKAELKLAEASAEQRSEAEKTLSDAGKVLEAARSALAAPTSSYTPLTGALKTLESNLESEESRRKPFPATSTGRRTALARWITDPRNPLSARVAVNHLWARHFGTALVPTLFDFGRKGARPSHPELLDWLAVEFIESGWSMKHIHRLIVTSTTYRMTSSSQLAADANLQTDHDNRYYWRMNPMRMEAQVVRDSLLRLAGELDLTPYGPSVPVSDESSRRRSMYFVHSHNEHQKFLSIFDDASVLECYRRSASIVPQQALALENSSLAGEMAVKIASSIESANPSATDDEFITLVFRLVLASDPSAEERIAASDALQQFREAAADADQSKNTARVLLLQAVLNHNDFVTIR